MKPIKQKISQFIEKALSRSEMKNIMAGSVESQSCGGCSDCFGWNGACHDGTDVFYCGMISDGTTYIRCYRPSDAC